MKNFLIAVVALSAAFAGATAVLAQQARPAQGPANAGQTCLQVDRVDSWNRVNSSTMVVTDKSQHKFRVTLNGNCAYTEFYDKVFYRPLTTSTVGCVGPSDRVNLSNRQGDVQRCIITSVSEYTDAQLREDQRNASPRP